MGGLDGAGVTDQERYAERRFVHETLVVPAVFAQIEAVVGGIYDEGVRGLAGFVEVVQDAAESFVDADDVAVHVLNEALVDPVFALGGGEVFGEVGVVGGEAEVEAHVFGFAGDFAGGEIVVEVGGEGEVDV